MLHYLSDVFLFPYHINIYGAINNGDDVVNVEDTDRKKRKQVWAVLQQANNVKKAGAKYDIIFPLLTNKHSWNLLGVPGKPAPVIRIIA